MTKLRLSKAEEENLIQVLLSTTPYIAMVIRNSDKVIVAANKLAEEIGVKIGDHCWRVFKKSEHLSAEAQKIASNYKESVPAELGIKCTFCLADDCFIGHPQQHLSKLSVNNRIWDVYWIKISDDLYLHYVIDQTEQLNRETELHLKNIILTTQLDTSLEGILVVDESGKVIIYNRRFVELWGIPDEILSTQRDDELLKNALASVADPEAFINRVEYLYQHPTENSYESIDLRDGRSLERYSAPIFDNSGKYYGRVWYFSDVTDRKRAEASIREREEKYRTLFDNSGDAIFIHDQKGIILSANDVAIRRLGYSYEELICNSIHNIDTPEDATNIPHRILRLLETGHIAFDTVHITKDGVKIPTEVNARLITWSGKQAIMSICRDITTRKQTEAAIQASEQLHSSIIETAMDGFWMVDMQGNLVEVNQTYCQISGYSRHELLAMNIADIEVVEDPAAVKEHIDKIMHNGEDRFVSKHRRKNGDLIHVEVSVQYRKIDGGHMVAFLRDITEQLAAEAELKSSEEKHRYILETAFNGFMLIDKQGNLREVNSTYCQLSGYTKAELLKMSITDLEANEDPNEITEYIRKVVTTGADRFESVHRRKDGSVYPVEVSAQYNPSRNGYMVVFIHDITERKQSEQTLKEEHFRLESILEGTHAGTWEWNVQTGETKFNEIWANIIGYTLDEISPVSIDTWIKYTHPEDLKHSSELLEAHFAGKTPQYECECRMKHKDGHWVWVLDRGKIITRTADGKPLLMFGIHIDITERIDTEHVLRKSEQKFRSLAESSQDYIMRYDREGRHTYMNPSALKVAGLTEDQIIGKTHLEAGFPEDLSKMWEERIEEVFKTGKQYNIEFAWESVYGLAYLDWQLTAEFDEKGEVFSVLGVSRDVTARKQAELEILNQHNRLERIIDGTQAGTWEWNVQSGETVFNNYWAEMLGYEIKELEPTSIKTWLTLLHPEDEKVTSEMLEQHFAGKTQKYECEFRMRHKAGHWVWILVRGKVISRSEDGKPLMMFGTHLDITNRKKAEQETVEALRFQQLIMNAIPTPVFYKSIQGRYLGCNTAFAEYLGLNRDEIIGKTAYDISPKELADKYRQADEEIFANPGRQTYESRIKYADGSYRDVLFHKATYNDNSGNLAGLIGVFLDITDRKLAEHAIIESEERYRSLFDLASDGIALATPEGYYISANNKLLDMLEYTLDEFVQMHISDIVAEQQLEQLPEHLVKLKQGKEPLSEWKLISKYGKIIPVEISASMLPNGNRLAFVRDVSERKKAELRIVQATDLLNKTEELAQFGSWEYDLVDNKLKWSDETYRIFGLEPQEIPITYARFLNAIHPDDRDMVDKAYSESLLDNLNENEIEHRILRVYTGEIRYVYQKWEHYRDDKGKIIRTNGFVQDVTQRKNIETAIVEHERLSAIGELASGVAHDFNNSLQAIIGNVELALFASDLSNELLEYLNSIKSTAFDASARVKQLQRFSHKESDKNHSPVNIEALIEETIIQTRPKWKDEIEKKGFSITFCRDYESSTDVIGNTGELRSTLYNLLNNAIEAMPEGGTISIRTYTHNNFLVTAISDTGIGMNEATAKRAFQPFFTTKGFELGRGMGLSSVFSTIRDHSGSVYIRESILGKGTTIEFTLPIFTPEHQAKNNQSSLKEEDLPSGASILWVDDDESIRSIGKKLLLKLGYKADTAESGEQALKLIQSQSYDLIITDIGMPNMTGWQLAERIQAIKPTKIAVVTGWGSEISDEEKKKYGVLYALGKPIMISELKKLIELTINDSTG